MPLPQGFSEWEHFQSVLMQTQNRIVREAFEDIQDTVDDDITAPRSALRWACLLKDDDSAVLTQLRLWMFYGVLRKARDFHPAMFTIPANDFQESREYKPQIQLFFQEDLADVEPGYAPITGEISIRLMNQTTETLTMAECQSYANAIRQIFASGNGFIWRKGKVMVPYIDKARGYQLQLLCRTQEEGERVIKAVLNIQNHTFVQSKMNINQNAAPSEAFPTNPGTITVLGKSKKRPRKRPIGDVRFQAAYIHIWGRPEPLVLVDRSGIHRNSALIFAS